jgi:hypothetical protein
MTAFENHFGENVWVYRKGATFAKRGESGIILGSYQDKDCMFCQIGKYKK